MQLATVRGFDVYLNGDHRSAPRRTQSSQIGNHIGNGSLVELEGGHSACGKALGNDRGNIGIAPVDDARHNASGEFAAIRIAAVACRAMNLKDGLAGMIRLSHQYRCDAPQGHPA